MSAEFTYIKRTFIVSACFEMQNTLSLGSTKGKIANIFASVGQSGNTMPMGKTIHGLPFICTNQISKCRTRLILHGITSEIFFLSYHKNHKMTSKRPAEAGLFTILLRTLLYRK